MPFDQDGLDLGFVLLNSYYEKLMKAVGHVPLSPSQCVLPNAPCRHFVLGFPSQAQRSSVFNGKTLDRFDLSILEMFAAPPESVNEKKFPRLAGKVFPEDIQLEGGQQLSRLQGMSGGPIVAFDSQSQAEVPKYWIVGVQNAWDESAGIA
ncbi:MAG: hypothetical protein KGS45_12455 [Planctomycetes bacterium]|nr:hypothetical protein [Planctomycetota bacterium]